MNKIDNSKDKKESLFDRAKKLPLLTRTVLTIILSLIWILIASNIEFDSQTNWIISTLVIAWISSIFFPFRKSRKSSDQSES